MFQDNKSSKKNVDSTQSKNIGEKVPSFIGKKMSDIVPEKVKKNVSKAQNIASVAQTAGSIIGSQVNTPNIPESASQDLWKNQPTSKIYNSKNIAEQQISGINRVVKLGIVIEGKSVKTFKHFKLVQSAKKHHEFSLELPYDVMGEAENHRLENAQNFLGKRLTVIFKYKDVEDSPERVFVGVITEVGFAQDQGSLGNIVVTGYSPTILLDAAPHTQSFGGSQPISLNSIADNVIKEGIDKSKFDYRIAAQYGNISYSSQYEETHYNYLARMAEAYGEQFYYDGEVLHFGQLPPATEPVALKYGSNVHDIKVSMKAQHVNPSFYGYNSSKNEKLTSGSSAINHKSDIAKRAYSISERTFKTPSLRVAPIKSSTSMDISTSQKGTAGSKAVDVFVTSGTTSIPFLYPGCVANIEMRQQNSNKTSYFTKLMVTEVTHEVDGRGYYNGYFEAIAADTGFLPRPEFEFPKAQPQVAKVISNTDPLNQGRIQVQFDWQNGGSQSEFIRVMTPDAGGSDKVSKNRGFMAIPEVGDQVMVGFQHNHPDRPFAMGGMFHGSVGGGGGQANNVKSLSSRSGNKLELNDGEGSVFLTDQGGANMKFDGAGNATMNTNQDYTNTAGKNHSTNVTNNHSINAGDTSMIDVGGNSVIQMDKSGNVSLTATTEFKITVGASVLTIKKDGTITINGKQITMDATDKMTVSGKNQMDIGSKTTNIAGKETVNVGGKKVKINT